MLVTAIILFILAALLGLLIVKAIFKNKSTPKRVVLMHGSFAGIALLLVIIYVITGHTSPLIITSLVLFIVAALGGLTMLTIDLSKKPIPKSFAIFHPLIAIIALTTLIIYLLG